MDIFMSVIDFILHIDEHLNEFINRYNELTYILLFLIVFCETGLVVTPFLPGDSLLFAAGALSVFGTTTGGMNIIILYIILISAAILGDMVNYHIGKIIGAKVFEKENRFIKKAYLDKTHDFYEKYGGKTIIFARFVPIVRTFAPFVAGVSEMTYKKFFSYNVIGAFFWVTIFLLAGKLFGTIPFVKENFTIVIMAIIAISVMPAVYEVVKEKMKKNKKNKQ